MRPDLFHAAVADVPFVDILNTMLDASLPLTPPEWPEWGDPIEDAEAYHAILAYCDAHHRGTEGTEKKKCWSQEGRGV